MSRADYVITSEAERDKMLADLKRAPLGNGFTVTAKRSKRTIAQSNRMWAMLGEVSKRLKYHTFTLSPNDWKLIFMDALGHEMRLVPNMAGTGIINLGGSSSELTIPECSDMMELITAYAAEQGVIIRSPKEKAEAEAEERAAAPPPEEPSTGEAPPHPGELIRTGAGAIEWANRWAARYRALPRNEEEAFIDETSEAARLAMGLTSKAEDILSNAINDPKTMPETPTLERT